MKHFALLPIIMTLGLIGCGLSSSPLPVTPTENKDALTPVPSSGDFGGAKTTLPFFGVSWPAVVSVAQRAAFAIGLNLSGSFEGNSGWSNLTNNFDGQGLSMGLLNQTLGTGSLQPLLIAMRTQFPQTFRGLFSSPNFQSLNAMLSAYQAKVPAALIERRWASDTPDSERALNSDLRTLNEVLSPLDYGADEFPIPGQNAEEVMAQGLTSPTSDSVQWAVANLYAGNQFKSDWKAQLNALGNDPQYISIQIQAAARLFLLARKYQSQLGFSDFKSFLFFFDISVQNGSLYVADVTDFLSWRKQATAVPDIATQLTQLLTLRLRHVRPQFVADVRARKLSIILGHGTVHGDVRDYAREYGVPLETIVP